MAEVNPIESDMRQDLRRQVKALDTLKEDFCSVFADLAKQNKAIIVAPSLPIIEGNLVFNRAYVFSQKGLVGYQDKFFMTRFENEEWGIHAASPKQLSVFEADWGSFGIQICYDVEFGIGSQRLCAAGASVILAPSCTETIRGATRVHIGARARALENQCYTVVAQTVGNAAWSPAVDVNYGYAAFYTTPDKNMPEEGIIAQNIPQKAEWLIQKLDLSTLAHVRTDGQVFNFKDHLTIVTRLREEEITVLKCTV